MTTENQKPNYRLYDLTGGGVTHDIYAETLGEAIKAGREWIEDGGWEPSTKAVTLACVVREIIYVAVDANGIYARRVGNWGVPEHDFEKFRKNEKGALFDENDNELGLAIGEIDEDASLRSDAHDCSGTAPVADAPDCADCKAHDWKSPYSVLGGCKENPGCWGSGHGQVKTTEVCGHCGVYRTIDCGATDSGNGTQCKETTYEEADEKSLAWIWGDKDEWEQWVRAHDDSDDLDDDDLVSAFRAIFHRAPDDADREEGLWSHLCAAIEA